MSTTSRSSGKRLANPRARCLRARSNFRPLRHELLEQRRLLSTLGIMGAGRGANLTTNVSGKTSLALAVSAAALGPNPMDNSHGPSVYAETGSGWNNGKRSASYLGNCRTHAGGGAGANAAEWTASGLASGTYEVLARWTPAKGQASDAPYTMADGALILRTTRVNQKVWPSGPVLSGVHWQSLGIVLVTGGTLTVALGDNANGMVVADAIWLKPGPAPTPKVAVAGVAKGDTTPSATEGTDFGSVFQGQDFLTRTYTVRNDGTAPLQLGSVSLPAGYHLTEPLEANLAPNTSDTFTVSLETASAGVFGGDVSFATSDSRGNPFHFRITGRVNPPAPLTVLEGLGQTIASQDVSPSTADGTNFGALALGQSAAETFTILNAGIVPLSLTGSPPVQVRGAQAGDFRITQPALTTVAPGDRVAFSVTFSPQALGSRTASVVVTGNDAVNPSYQFTISGIGLEAPPVQLGAPAPGIRVKQVAPEYAGTNVYHTLYLPTDWTPGGHYPVIVEYPPNAWKPSGSAGTVDDTVLGYYQSGGEGFIWVTMPFIDSSTRPASNATWTSSYAGMQATADYTRVNLARILEDYGGDGSSVFVTGFSRGAIGAGAVGLYDARIADIWAGFLPHSHADTNPTQLDLVAGRPSFLTWGGGGDGAPRTV